MIWNCFLPVSIQYRMEFRLPKNDGESRKRYFMPLSALERGNIRLVEEEQG